MEIFAPPGSASDLNPVRAEYSFNTSECSLLLVRFAHQPRQVLAHELINGGVPI